MAIISWPESMSRNQFVPCSICHQETPLTQATVGLRHSDGRQAFACNQHFWSSSQLIIGWTDFAIRQQALRRQKELASVYQTYEKAGDHDQPLH